MALTALHQMVTFGVGDRVKVIQKIIESGKTRSQTFEGWVIGIKGREENKTFTVRRIGEGQIGIERIYPLASPTIEKVEVVRQGTRGVKRAKLYFTREKSNREIDKIYTRAKRRQEGKRVPKERKIPRKKSGVSVKGVKSSKS